HARPARLAAIRCCTVFDGRGGGGLRHTLPINQFLTIKSDAARSVKQWPYLSRRVPRNRSLRTKRKITITPTRKSTTSKEPSPPSGPQPSKRSTKFTAAPIV